MTRIMLVIFIALICIASCTNKEEVGVIVSLRKIDNEFGNGQLKGLTDAEISWLDEKRGIQSKLVFPGKFEQIVVPEGTKLMARVRYLIVYDSGKKPETQAENYSFTAVKNNPNWQLP